MREGVAHFYKITENNLQRLWSVDTDGTASHMQQLLVATQFLVKAVYIYKFCVMPLHKGERFQKYHTLKRF
jgi:hypothetical protein